MTLDAIALDDIKRALNVIIAHRMGGLASVCVGCLEAKGRVYVAGVALNRSLGIVVTLHRDDRIA